MTMKGLGLGERTVSPGAEQLRQEPSQRYRLSLGQAVLLFVATLFQHFQLVAPFGYPLTLGAIAAIAVLFVIPGGVDWVRFLWVFPAIAAYTATAALLDPRYASPIQYVRTLGLICVAISFVIAGSGGIAEGRTQRRSMPMHAPLLTALVLIVALAVIQVVTGLSGSTAFFNPFGQFQYLYHYDPWLNSGETPRAASFFLEPSYAALVITFLVAALLKLSTYSPLTLLLGAVGVLACQSANGLIAYAVIVLVWALGLSRTAVRAGLLVAVGLLLLLTRGYLLTRITSAEDSTSSAYYRLVAPQQLVSDVLSWNPLGRALGSVEEAASAANLRNGLVAGASIDNGYALVMFYFGWGGLVLVFLTIAVLLRRIVKSMRDGTGSAPVLSWVLLSFMFNGGILLPEFAFMVWLSLGVASTRRGDGLDAR